MAVQHQGPQIVFWVNTETVYSARREADLVMTSIGNLGNGIRDGGLTVTCCHFAFVCVRAFVRAFVDLPYVAT
jgi:hypothetical protein